VSATGISPSRRRILEQAQGYVLLCYHNHQPPLVMPGTINQRTPYARMHAMRGYRDLPLWTAEKGVSATFNMTPSLLEQLEVYTKGGSDVFLDLTKVEADRLTEEQKLFLLSNFFKLNHDHSVLPYPRYKELLEKSKRTSSISDFSTQEFLDLQVWFNLAMFGYGLRRSNSEIRAFMDKQRNFTEADKRRIIEIQMGVIREVLGNYKKLQEEGKISVIVSPYVHPILPLIIDEASALEAHPDWVPPMFSHPDDARAQLDIARIIYCRMFGRDPSGMWPSEGSVSHEMLPLVSQAIPSVRYLLTDEGIRERSCPLPEAWWQRFLPWQAEGLSVFFRDRRLSDAVGFVRMERHALTAYEMYQNICRIALDAAKDGMPSGMKPVVSMVLDGENMQDSRPNDAFEFFDMFYRYLMSDGKLIAPILPEEYLELFPNSPQLNHLFAGSWIGSDFGTWTGDRYGDAGAKRIHVAKGHLAKLKRAIELRYGSSFRDTAMQEIYGKASEGNLFSAFSGTKGLAPAILYSLQAESSCFMWWFGGRQGEAADLGVFDIQFRELIATSYLSMGMIVPSELQVSLYHDRPWGEAVGPLKLAV